MCVRAVWPHAGDRPRANRLHNMFKLAYLLDCDKSQPWQPVFFSPICHLQAVCRHLGWCCMATGRVPTVSIICSSSHTYLIATSRSPWQPVFFPYLPLTSSLQAPWLVLHGDRPRANRLNSMLKLAYLIDCDMSQPLAAINRALTFS